MGSRTVRFYVILLLYAYVNIAFHMCSSQVSLDPPFSTTSSYYPYGQSTVCDPEQDPNCREPCDTEPGCEQYYSTHTCSILHFCPAADATSTEALYELPDFEATKTCDFSSAIVLGEMNGAQSDSDGCFQYVFDAKKYSLSSWSSSKTY